MCSPIKSMGITLCWVNFGQNYPLNPQVVFFGGIQFYGIIWIAVEIILLGWDLGISGPDRAPISYTPKLVSQPCTDRILISKAIAPGRAV